ncbi:MAG: glycosyltransferase family 2 protein [Anaerolineales bacterium]|nr:glycosyltransferase family 2 protein [Anaerolineales bacterium]
MKFSLIVPVCNGGADFTCCLSALAAARTACADLAATELIVVDDGSTDQSAANARAAGAKVLATPAPGSHGPAAARNLGARAATGDYVFFVDADVALHPDALRRAAEAFAADPRLEAVFGSYDDAPSAPNFLSQYKNLLHHYVHQHAHTQASTFWTGCGALRLSTFQALGGFDALTYQRPSIEDIDLGYRLRRRGGEIRLLKDMQCVHLKRWTARSLLRSDFLERGLPWTILLWRESRARRTSEPLLATGDLLRLPDAALARRPFQLDLNLQTSNRVSVALAALLALGAAALPFAPRLWPLAALAALALLALNRHLYQFFARKRGLGFALAAIPWHWLYYFYNNLSFGLGTLLYFARGARPVAADGALAEADPVRASDA